MNVLITGATGFVGQSLVKYLTDEVCAVRVALRTLENSNPQQDVYCVGNINANTNWENALAGIDVVIHLAARVHVMKEVTTDPLAEFRQVNVEGTLNLAKQAAKAGVKRFVFLSSIKVNGEYTTQGKPFTSLDTPNPKDAYGLSKFEAEQGLFALAAESVLEVVIIRPPLIYGADVKANFRSLAKLAQLNIPLPFGSIDNKRSLVFIDNLIDLIVLSVHHPAASNQILLISDDDDVSTTELIKRIKESSGKRYLLLPVPQNWLNLLFKLIGKPSLSDRLLGNLQVDITKTKALLNWKPQYSVKEGIERTVSNKCTE